MVARAGRLEDDVAHAVWPLAMASESSGVQRMPRTNDVSCGGGRALVSEKLEQRRQGGEEEVSTVRSIVLQLSKEELAGRYVSCGLVEI